MHALDLLIHKSTPPIQIGDSIKSIQTIFNNNNLSHLPVLDNQVFIGNVSRDDIDTFYQDDLLQQYRYVLEPYFAREQMNILEVLHLLAINHSNVIPVLGKNSEYLGFYAQEDLFDYLTQSPFLREQGHVLVVSKEKDNYSFSQICQITESNNAKILGLYVSEADELAVEITLKLSLTNLNDVIQTFRRYNYQIISEHQDDRYLTTLKERSEYLDKYLNL